MASTKRGPLVTAIVVTVAAAILWLDQIFVEKFQDDVYQTVFFTLLAGWMWIQWRRARSD